MRQALRATTGECPATSSSPYSTPTTVVHAAAERRGSTAGGLLKSARQRALSLHFKHTNCDGYPNGRACQLQPLVLRWLFAWILRGRLSLQAEASTTVAHRENGDPSRLHPVNNPVLAVKDFANVLPTHLGHYTA